MFSKENKCLKVISNKFKSQVCNDQIKEFNKSLILFGSMSKKVKIFVAFVADCWNSK